MVPAFQPASQPSAACCSAQPPQRAEVRAGGRHPHRRGLEEPRLARAHRPALAGQREGQAQRAGDAVALAPQPLDRHLVHFGKPRVCEIRPFFRPVRGIILLPTTEQGAHPMTTPVAPGTRIGHVHLKVADLDRAIAFY